MIAPENFAPLGVMQAQGSVLTDKDAEGYPGRRYHGGCEHVDVVEQLALDRVKALFGADAANVQPHSGAQANAAVMAALPKPGDTILVPDQQGRPLEHVIAARAVAFGIAATPAFVERQQRTLEGAQLLAERLDRDDVRARGTSVLTGGTDVHLVLVDLSRSELDGQQAEDRLRRIGITVNRDAVPFDPRPPMVSSGPRIGTPALATRGFGGEEFAEVAHIVATPLVAEPDEAGLAVLRGRVRELAGRFPLYTAIGSTQDEVLV